MTLPETDELPLPVFTTDPDGRIEHTNAAFERLLPGRAGMTWSAAFPGLQREPAPGTDRAGRLSVGNGGQQDQPRCFDLLLEPLAEADRERPRLMGVLVDVTEHTRREAELLAILDTAVDAIIIIDESGRVETFNEAATELFGYQQEEIIGQSVNLLMPEPHRSRHDEYMRRYMTTGEKRIIGIGRELEGQTRSGERVPIYLAVSEITEKGRRRFTGIIRDLSEQQATREALAEQRERLAHVGRLSTMGEMTASIAHEINQPLTAISMYAQSALKLVRRGDPDPGKLGEALDKLNTQSLRAGAIIERIQRFARSQESRRELLDVNELIRELVKLAEGDARLHDVSITFDLEDALPPVHADPVHIQQVALNLIRNAIDAMKEVDCRYGNALAISTRSLADGYVELAVSDQGPGVAPEQMNLLFKPFHTTKKDGMGMGLSICRTIVAEHGGVLSFRNNPDVGATFYFTLPAAERNAHHDG